jgi:calcium-dependent protein kinase
MHHLSGVFIKEDKVTVIEEKTYYTFKMIYPQKDRDYYVESKEEYHNWVKYLSKAIGFFDLSTKYEIGSKLGNGKFGLVKLAINKSNDQKYAAKFMSKKEMSNVDLELVRTEIEILKVCQHPNIIRIYDVFENVDSFYICKYICITHY